MSAIYSDIDQYEAITAANAASDGQREATFLSVWQTRLGTNPTLNLYREGTKVWSATISSLLSIQGSAFVVPTTITQTTISAADIDTGSWEFRIEKASDSTVYYGATVTLAGGTDVLALSADTEADGSITLGSIVFNAPSLDTVSQVLTRNDSRVVMWFDPNYTFAQQLHGYGVQISDALSGTTVYSIAEPGVIGTGSEYTLERVTSPYSDGTAFLSRVDPDYPLWGNTQRAQVRQHNTLLDDTIYWMAFEFTVESNWTASGGFQFADIHHNSWTALPGKPLPPPYAPLNIYGSTAPGFSISIAGSYVSGFSGETRTSVYSSGTMSAGDVVRLAMRFRITRSQAVGPFFQAWRSLNGGATTLIVDRSDLPLGYVDMVADQCYAKAGMYAWSSTGPTRTTYMKGPIVVREATGTTEITADNLIATVASL